MWTGKWTVSSRRSSRDSSMGRAPRRSGAEGGARAEARPTVLSAEQERESAIESLAENLNDSGVAPLFWFAVAGLPGAALYRFANTADAMWGYRGEREGRVWEWAGKWAAWADDALSWLPARLTALLLQLAAWRRVPGLAQQARLTPSPNSGWPMAAMARLLGVALGKPGVYTLNAGARAPTPADTQAAIDLAQQVLIWALMGVTMLVLLRFVIADRYAFTGKANGAGITSPNHAMRMARLPKRYSEARSP